MNGTRFWRSTTTEHLTALLNRCSTVNEQPFAYKVKRVLVFGSYVNTDRDRIGDLDIGVELELKQPGLLAERAALAPPSSSWLRRMFWPIDEVYRFLKGSSPIISVHSVDEVIGGRYPYLELWKPKDEG